MSGVDSPGRNWYSSFLTVGRNWYTWSGHLGTQLIQFLSNRGTQLIHLKRSPWDATDTISWPRDATPASPHFRPSGESLTDNVALVGVEVGQPLLTESLSLWSNVFPRNGWHAYAEITLERNRAWCYCRCSHLSAALSATFPAVALINSVRVISSWFMDCAVLYIPQGGDCGFSPSTGRLVSGHLHCSAAWGGALFCRCQCNCVSF